MSTGVSAIGSSSVPAALCPSGVVDQCPSKARASGRHRERSIASRAYASYNIASVESCYHPSAGDVALLS
jgi:hypothetical protein